MKTIILFTTVIFFQLIASLWLVHLNIELLLEKPSIERPFETTIQEHVNAVLSGEKTETVDHLLAVLQRTAKAVTTGDKVKESSADSLKNMQSIIVIALLFNILVIILLIVQYNKALNTDSAKDAAPVS